MVEQPNTDFAHVIVRQFLFDCFHFPLLEQLTKSKDETIAAIATKSYMESKYHIRFSTSWVKRLGDGTEVSHEKMQAAINHLYPFVHEFFNETEIEKEAKEAGIGADISKIKEEYDARVKEVFAEANLQIPEIPNRKADGKMGIHSEQMGFILAELQYIQRAYPNMEW